MPSISESIKFTRFNKSYSELYKEFAGDPNDVITNNAEWVKILNERLLIAARVVYTKQDIGEVTKAFYFLRNDDADIYTVNDQVSLDLFLNEFDDINFGDGVIVFTI